MKIIYYTKPPYLDCDLPFIQSLTNNNLNVITLIDLPPYYLKSSLLNITDQINLNNIFKADKYKEFKIFKNYLNLNNVYIINRTNKKTFALSNILLSIKLFTFIYKQKPKIIHTTFFYEIRDYLLYIFRDKTVLTVHDPFLHYGERNLKSIIYRKIGLRIINNLMLLNNQQREEFIKINKLKKHNILVNRIGIYNVYNLFATNKNLQHEEYILFFGRISPYKGIKTLLDAEDILAKESTSIKIIIAGNGKFDFKIDTYQHNKNLKFINRYIENEELVKLIQNCLFVVCPYLDATQSGVVMTSYNFCKTIIATDVGAMRENIKNNYTGIIIKPSDPKILAEHIKYLLQNRGKIKDMENNIYQEYHIGNNGWAKISEETKLFYTKIINTNYEKK